MPKEKIIDGASQNPMPEGGFAITPSDVTELTQPAYGLNVQSAGVAKVTMLDGSTPTIYLVQGWNPGVYKKIWSTGLGASGITGMI